MQESPKKPFKWHHPLEVMKLQKLKMKKKALQARIKGSSTNESNNASANKTATLENILNAKKRRNPFMIEKEDKKPKRAPVLEESADQTLFHIIHNNAPQENVSSNGLTSFNNILNQTNVPEERVEIVKVKGEEWLPVDWSLKSRVRLISAKPFPWTSKLKISEESSGLVSFTRCLNTDSDITLDTSASAKFHQCCMYWQYPYLPWLSMFPRTTGKISATGPNTTSPQMRDGLYTAWKEGLRSLFQLVRTRHCPYFYVYANNFTVLFRAAGVGGFGDIHAIITPTTRGLRSTLKQEEVEFTMPLKKKRNSDLGYDTLDSTLSEQSADLENTDEALDDDDDETDEAWLKSLGINAEDIKQINFNQSRINHKKECSVDNSEQSLLLVEGVEVHPLYNFLINCKSATALTGPLAGVPPTLLAPVAFTGATLQSLRVRENKVHVDDADFYSLELLGPILPTTVHNLFAVSPPEHNITATFVSVPSTVPLSKVTLAHSQQKGTPVRGSAIAVFGKENLSDCGLNAKVLKYLCWSDQRLVTSTECLKYVSEEKTFTWL